MAPTVSARERDLLDYLRRQADDQMIASLPTARLRVLAMLTPDRPIPIKSWKGDA